MSKKIVYDTDDETWNKVKIYKIRNKLKNNNEALNRLVIMALGTLKGENGNGGK